MHCLTPMSQNDSCRRSLWPREDPQSLVEWLLRIGDLYPQRALVQPIRPAEELNSDRSPLVVTVACLYYNVCTRCTTKSRVIVFNVLSGRIAGGGPITVWEMD